MTHKYRIESGQFVGQVDVADGKIVAAPNVWRKFIGQPPDNLLMWLARNNRRCTIDRIPDLAHPEAERKCYQESAASLSKPTLADVVLPTYCGCNELLENIEQLEAHVERVCWK